MSHQYQPIGQKRDKSKLGHRNQKQFPCHWQARLAPPAGGLGILARAQVGIAMGTGTDVAIESAGVTLRKGDLLGIAQARRLGRATMGNIRQNLFFALVYNALGVARRREAGSWPGRKHLGVDTPRAASAAKGNSKTGGAGQALAEKPIVRIEREGTPAKVLGLGKVARRLLQGGQAGQGADRTRIDVRGLPESMVGLVEQLSLQALLGVGNEVDLHFVARQIVGRVYGQRLREKVRRFKVSTETLLHQPLVGGGPRR